MKNIIWLSPSLAAGAIAARLVVFFKTASRDAPWGAETYGPSRPAGFQTGRGSIVGHHNTCQI